MTQRRVAIVEDQTVFREMLVELLRLDPAFDVVAAYGRGEDALGALARDRPDLLIVDLVLPDMHGLDVLRRARAVVAGLRVLVVTALQKPAVVLDAFRAQADGIVTKGASLRELQEAVRRVAAGGVYYCGTTSAVLRRSRNGGASDEPLSEREQQIVRLVALGRSSKEIASELAISPKTVANHRLRIGRKLGFGDVAGLTRYAINRGWVADDA